MELSAKVPFDDRINHKAEINDLDRDLIRDFLKTVNSGLHEEVKGMEFVDLCERMNIIRGVDNMSSKRLVVTIPENDYERLEKEKKEKGLNRSEFVSNIIEAFFQQEDEEKKVMQYVSGYKKNPEKVKEIESLEKASAEVIGEF